MNFFNGNKKNKRVPIFEVLTLLLLYTALYTFIPTITFSCASQNFFQIGKSLKHHFWILRGSIVYFICNVTVCYVGSKGIDNFRLDRFTQSVACVTKLQRDLRVDVQVLLTVYQAIRCHIAEGSNFHN